MSSFYQPRKALAPDPGIELIRQICFSPSDPSTTFLGGDYPWQTVDVFNPSEWTKT